MKIQSRLDILKSFKKSAKKKEHTYSAIMRDLRKNNPENVISFMKSFKEAFDQAVTESLEDPDKLALMQAIKATNYGS